MWRFVKINFALHRVMLILCDFPNNISAVFLWVSLWDTNLIYGQPSYVDLIMVSGFLSKSSLPLLLEEWWILLYCGSLNSLNEIPPMLLFFSPLDSLALNLIRYSFFTNLINSCSELSFAVSKPYRELIPSTIITFDAFLGKSLNFLFVSWDDIN